MAHSDSGSINYSYGVHPDDDKKQAPLSLPDNARERYVPQQTCSLVKTPNWVYVNATPTDNLLFFFGSSASFSEKVTADIGAGQDLVFSMNCLSSSAHYVNFGKPTVGSTLHIHPTAWSGSKADHEAGVITFVYASGLHPQRP